jgi:hypothetical protein
MFFCVYHGTRTLCTLQTEAALTHGWRFGAGRMRVWLKWCGAVAAVSVLCVNIACWYWDIDGVLHDLWSLPNLPARIRMGLLTRCTMESCFDRTCVFWGVCFCLATV